jgi:hypothetical protein
MRKVLLTLALAALLVLPVAAQRFGFGGGGLDANMLLANKGVQDELKLSDSQKKDIKAASDARQKAVREAFKDRETARENMQKAGEEFNKAMKKVADGLTATQKKRLLGIEVQAATKNNNPRIFQNTAVQKALKLTEKQQKTIKSTFTDYEKDLKELREESKGDFRKMGEKMREMSKEAYTTISKTLTDDQKKALKDLEGEKFELKFDRPGFGKEKGKKGRKGNKDD